MSSYIVDQIVYSSSAERIISLTVIFIVLIITFVSQASVIVTILKTERLHIPNFIVILCYCVGDLIMVISSSTLYIYHFLYYCMPRVLCRILSSIGVSFAFGLASLTGLMAFERYMYLCSPMKYDRLFKHRLVVIASCIIYGCPLIYSIATEIWLGRSYHATVLACYLPGSGTKSVIQILLFILPAATITIISMLKIWRLMVSCSVGPADLPNNGITPATVNPTIQAKKAFKMVGMVSGTFWGTILPSMIFRMILFSSGFDWPDLDLRTGIRMVDEPSHHDLHLFLSVLTSQSFHLLLQPERPQASLHETLWHT